jgi:hypothetical protein
MNGPDISGNDPLTEARACVRVARANGGIEKMREVIEITPQAKKELRHLVRIGVISELLFNRTIHFRAAVLHEFDRLTTPDKSLTDGGLPIVSTVGQAGSDGAK